jgi:hypothetical protein
VHQRALSERPALTTESARVKPLVAEEVRRNRALRIGRFPRERRTRHHQPGASRAPFSLALPRVNEKGDSVASFSPAVRRAVPLPERPQVDEEHVLAQIKRIMAGENDPFLVWKRLRWIAVTPYGASAPIHLDHCTFTVEETARPGE